MKRQQNVVGNAKGTASWLSQAYSEESGWVKNETVIAGGGGPWSPILLPLLLSARCCRIQHCVILSLASSSATRNQVAIKEWSRPVFAGRVSWIPAMFGSCMNPGAGQSPIPEKWRQNRGKVTSPASTASVSYPQHRVKISVRNVSWSVSKDRMVLAVVSGQWVHSNKGEFLRWLRGAQRGRLHRNRDLCHLNHKDAHISAALSSESQQWTVQNIWKTILLPLDAWNLEWTCAGWSFSILPKYLSSILNQFWSWPDKSPERLWWPPLIIFSPISCCQLAFRNQYNWWVCFFLELWK